MQRMVERDMNNRPVLVVEDEAELANALCMHLQSEGFETAWLSRGDDVSAWLDRHTPRLMLLDQSLPGKMGLDVCREVRRYSNLPIIMVSARVDVVDRLLGLEHGADDYICKPFSPREVVARVKTVLRRAGMSRPEIVVPKRMHMQFDDRAWRAVLAGCDIQLTAIEYRLLRMLAQACGRLYTRTQLITEIYPDGRQVTDRTIDSHVRKVRAKIESLQPGFDPIQTVYGVGYRFVSDGVIIRGTE